MATKRRRLKNKKNNNRKTKKVGGNPFKTLGKMVDEAASKFITDEGARGLAGLPDIQPPPQSSAATTESALAGPPDMQTPPQNSAATTESAPPEDEEDLNALLEESDKLSAAEASANQDKEAGSIGDESEREEENTGSGEVASEEAESTSKQSYIAKVAREVSLAARRAADALVAMKIDVKKADESKNEDDEEVVEESEVEPPQSLEVSIVANRADEIKRLTERNIELLNQCNKIIGENFKPILGAGPKSALKSNPTKKKVTISEVDESKQNAKIKEILVIIKNYLPATVLDDKAIKSVNELLSSDLNTPLTEDIKVEIGYIKQIISNKRCQKMLLV